MSRKISIAFNGILVAFLLVTVSELPNAEAQIPIQETLTNIRNSLEYFFSQPNRDLNGALSLLNPNELTEIPAIRVTQPTTEASTITVGTVTSQTDANVNSVVPQITSFAAAAGRMELPAPIHFIRMTMNSGLRR
ncbi:uncharacterized protein LOC119669497 [Teleopsis dalmanni]|uniref:uncharacterized protein LOC119669497 n=1 Tax=Teleopsis dalmanni TaxID=139649 RepID=UPI0018CF3FBC|nr:uncharacterized protein LOC119669497 [Teleopsis dalmanni]